MRTYSKIALFGLAVAGLAWWLGRNGTSSGTASASARTYDDLAPSIDTLVADDLGIDADAVEVDVDEDDVGLTSRRFVDVDQVYAGQEMGDAYALQIDEPAGASVEELVQAHLSFQNNR